MARTWLQFLLAKLALLSEVSCFHGIKIILDGLLGSSQPSSAEQESQEEAGVACFPLSYRILSIGFVEIIDRMIMAVPLHFESNNC